MRRSSGQGTKNRELAGSAYIDFAIHNGRNRKLYSASCLVALGLPIARIQETGQIRGIISPQDRRPFGVVGSDFQRPENGVFGALRRDRESGPRVTKDFLRGGKNRSVHQSITERKCPHRITAATHVNASIPVRRNPPHATRNR